MQTLFRTPFNYLAVKSSTFHRPLVAMERVVRVADTDIKQDGASFSDLNSTSANSYYTNADVPIKVFGNGILSTPFNPLTQKVHKTSQSDAATPTSELSNASPVDSAAAAVVTE